VYALELDGPALKSFLENLVKQQELTANSLLERLDPFQFTVDEKTIEEIMTLVRPFTFIP